MTGLYPQIIWDVIDRSITIIDGDRVVDLRERFRNREDGIRAAEAYCRRHMRREADAIRVAG
ncbi:hypothetical protein [Rhizobium sp. G21]|uniref:hypothetical protein n=1 Tax=Rhizobium sp. G21 TaxID=2758439 RepID=UPI0016029724|nr:hypothetical protein [Rhizobium sp. G21]MBB1248836.1 hypothetical protein [Rhizobium sp. G21]